MYQDLHLKIYQMKYNQHNMEDFAKIRELKKELRNGKASSGDIVIENYTEENSLTAKIEEDVSSLLQDKLTPTTANGTTLILISLLACITIIVYLFAVIRRDKKTDQIIKQSPLLNGEGKQALKEINSMKKQFENTNIKIDSVKIETAKMRGQIELLMEYIINKK